MPLTTFLTPEFAIMEAISSIDTGSAKLSKSPFHLSTSRITEAHILS
jgi:hypothetical protein